MGDAGCFILSLLLQISLNPGLKQPNHKDSLLRELVHSSFYVKYLHEAQYSRHTTIIMKIEITTIQKHD